MEKQTEKIVERFIEGAAILLGRVKNIYEDGIFFENSEWQKPELCEACIEFVAVFKLIADFFSQGDLPYKFHEEYHKLNTLFCRYFGIFTVCEDFLRGLENSNGHWFLRESPQDKPVIAVFELRDEHIPLLGKLLREKGLSEEEHNEVDLIFGGIQKNIV